MASTNELTITPYSSLSFVVRGEETKKYKKKLGELGGRWNANLKGGPRMDFFQ